MTSKLIPIADLCGIAPGLEASLFSRSNVLWKLVPSLLTASGIAVLGIEVFPGLNVSTYDLHMKDPANEKYWPGYRKNQQRARRRLLKKRILPQAQVNAF